MKYLIQNKDGSVLIMTTTADDISVGDEIAKWSNEEKDNAILYKELNESDIPEDRYFRDSWVHSDDRIVIDMPKAVKIHTDRLREIRNEKLKELDILSARASESKDEVKLKFFLDKKQELRDVPTNPDILNAKTPEELKSVMPSVLTEVFTF